jgi:molecular chaperone DnaJ
MATTTDYYELLGVSRNATDEELRRAYRRLARNLHPDANGGDPESEARFKEVTLAYETLRDPERRRRYDLFGPEAVRGTGAGGGPGDIFTGGLGDLFGAFFGGSPFGGSPSAGTRRGEDIELVLELSFEEAVFGAQRELRLRGAVACTTCEGSGAQPGTLPSTCPECGGAGQVRRVRQSILGQVVTTTPCARCQGMGQVVTSPCRDCRGEGRRIDEHPVRVDVPAGVDDGTTLRIPGAGNAPQRGGVPGDCYVHLKVEPDERYGRAGTDLTTDLHVAFTQAALGATLELETLDGPESIQITPGTQSGKIIRLRGKGVPQLRGRGRGDLHVRVLVDTPTSLPKEQEALLRQLAAMRHEEVAHGEGGLFSRIRSSLG